MHSVKRGREEGSRLQRRRIKIRRSPPVDFRTLCRAAFLTGDVTYVARSYNPRVRRKGLTPGRFDILGNSGTIVRRRGAVTRLIAGGVLRVCVTSGCRDARPLRAICMRCAEDLHSAYGKIVRIYTYADTG